ncbi:MarR family winged helix-turn-helix transcriptional regulator [Paraherbaspirillum soli]|uniref:MarR family winged helix-turn-helix transcriptional regulator n=1 Tax=Paraherbaspirillum soli TaxID=631222 RepID=A0ABW0MCW7_9BURK
MSTAPMKLSCHCGTIRQAARGITALYDEFLLPHGIKVTQFTLLMTIKTRKESSTGDLASALLLDSTTLSRTLATLKKMELVDVRPGADLRVRLWCLTDGGKSLLAACEKDWKKAQDKVSRIFGRQSIEQLDRNIYELSTKIAADGIVLSS